MEDKRASERMAMATATGSKVALLPGYVESLPDLPSKEMYREKLSFIGGKDPYEIPKQTWKDDIDLCYLHQCG